MPRLPELPAVALAGRYLPAASAGSAATGTTRSCCRTAGSGMAIGDVVGRGFHAAAIMGQLRSGLRAYAMEGIAPERRARAAQPAAPPARARPHGDRRVPDPGPHGSASTVAAAGRPPPLVQSPDGEPYLLEIAGSVPLGATRHARYEDHRVEL